MDNPTKEDEKIYREFKLNLPSVSKEIKQSFSEPTNNKKVLNNDTFQDTNNT